MRTGLPPGVVGNDDLQTPDALALDIVRHFRPQMHGGVLEPCAGDGAFLRAFETYGVEPVYQLDIKNAKTNSDGCSDFFDWHVPVSWIMTNPPWSQARKFALHAYELATDIVFLITIGHYLGFRARTKDRFAWDFGIKEVYLVDTPRPPWPQSGFQLGAIHFRKHYTDGTAWSVAS